MFRLFANFILGYDNQEVDEDTQVIEKQETELEKQDIEEQNIDKQDIKNDENCVKIDVLEEQNIDYELMEKKIYKEFIENIDKKLYDVLTEQEKQEIIFTNKIRRNIKTNMMLRCNIVDNILSNPMKHYNGVVVCNDTYPKYVEELMLYRVIKNSATKSFEKIKKKYNKIKTLSESNLNKQEALFKEAYERYQNDLLEKKIVMKVNKDNLHTKVYSAYIELNNIKSEEEKNEISIELKSELDQYKQKLESELNNYFTNENEKEQFVNSIVLCLDNSGSMNGEQIKLGCFYLLMLCKIFNLNENYYFNNDTTKYDKFDYIESSWEECIKHLYVYTNGSTNLMSFIDIMNKTILYNQQNEIRKNVIIFTDGDCDPSHPSSTETPFKKKLDNMYNVIVVNLNTDNLCYPYTIRDENVCYIGGSNPNLLSGFIKSWIETIKKNKPLKSEDILNNCLTDYKLNFNVNNYLTNELDLSTNKLSDYKKQQLYQSFVKNFN
jgi:hypothetical protein